MWDPAHNIARKTAIRTAYKTGASRCKPAHARGWARLLCLPLCVASFAGSLDASQTNATVTTPLRSGYGTFVAVGDAGAIVRSEDEGTTWTLAKSTATKRGLIKVVASSGLLVAVGEGGTIVRSVDKGVSWLPAYHSGTSVDLVDAIAEANGTLLAIGYGGTAVRSVDGGLNWAASRKTGTSAQLQSLIAEPHGALVALCDGGVLLRSIDDGLTWTVVVERRGTLFQGIAVTRNGTLVAVGGQEESPNSPRSAVVLRSVDGGGHWSTVGVNLPDIWLSAVTAETRGALLALGQSGEMFRSADEGLNWSRVDTGTQAVELDGIVEQDRILLATGVDGTILRSVDGGTSWSRQYSQRAFFILGLSMGSTGNATAVGAYAVHSEFFGLMAHSSDGGITWSKVPEFGTKQRLLSVVHVADGLGQNK